MIVTIISLAITVINCLVYFAPLLDYLTSEYWMARRISTKIANEDLHKYMPDIVDLAASIQNTLTVLIVVLRIFQVSITYLSGAIVVFAVATIVFFVGLIANSCRRISETLRVVFGIILVLTFCLAI